jgi:hypothetical protein
VTETLDDLYLAWLYSQVGDVKEQNKSKTYWKLLRRMYETEFVWLIPNDDNRVMDGLDLRYEFVAEEGVMKAPDWLQLGCSFLEMLVALSRRLAFEGEGHAGTWFWHLVENLDLIDCTDRTRFDIGEVDEILDRVIFRRYSPDGIGGLFPLRHARRDQRDVELWYQMQAYLIEG